MRMMGIRALLPVSWHYEHYMYGNFDPRTSRRRTRFGSELRSICISEAENLAHARAGSPLHIMLAWERQWSLLGVSWGSDFEDRRVPRPKRVFSGTILGIMGNWGEPVALGNDRI